MAHVPLEDESLDVAIFSLSLMGANFTDYLREAHRSLKLDGHLHVIEATSRSPIGTASRKTWTGSASTSSTSKTSGSSRTFER